MQEQLKNRVFKVILLIILVVLVLGFLAYLGGYMIKSGGESGFRNYVVYEGRESLAKEIKEEKIKEWINEEVGEEKYQNFVSDEYGFKIKHPVGWKIIGIDNTFNFYGINSIKLDIFIKIIENEDGLDLEEYVNTKIVQGKLAFENGFKLESEKFIINNFDVCQIKCSDDQFKYIETFIISLDKKKVIELGVLDDGRVGDIYNDMLESFEFLSESNSDWVEFKNEDISFKYPKALDKEKTRVMSPNKKERNFYDYGLFKVGGLRNASGFILEEAVKENYYSGGEIDFESIEIGQGKNINALKIKLDGISRYFFAANNFVYVFLVDEGRETEVNEILNTLKIVY